MVVFRGWYAGGSYNRYPLPEVVQRQSPRIAFLAVDMLAGSKRPFAAAAYTLLVDGAPHATVAVAAGASEASFELNFAALGEGWHQLDIVGLASGETCAPWFAYVLKGAHAAPHAKMPLVIANYTLMRMGNGRHWSGLVPARFSPTPHPLPSLDCPPIAELTSQSQLRQTHLVPWRENDIYRPQRRGDGVWHTVTTQSYAYFHLIAKSPPFALLDGPRGVGTLMMPTHLQLGRGGKVYFSDPWRVGKVDADGTVTTLAGLRHDEPGGAVSLVGDWSGVPAPRRGFHELWGLAWDVRSLAVDESAAPRFNGRDVFERPHASPPRAFVADSQNDRVCLLTFRRDAHEPAAVSEFIAGLADPFDVVCEDGVLYISERGAHRIAAWDATTGAYLRTVVSGRALSSVQRTTRFVVAGAPLADIRAEPCVGPEGLYLQDGWLYFGSRAMAQIRRVHLATGALETVVAECRVDGNSHFIKIALSDGTFGARGKPFYSSWTSDNAGRPMGVPGNYNDSYTGPGTPWETLGYSSALAVGQGRLVCGSSSEGLTVLHSRRVDDAVVPVATWRRLKAAWVEGGHQLLHGHDGHGFLGLPLPWGASADVDEYLRLNGHRRPV